MTLDELLEGHIKVIRKVAATVGPHEDVAPMMAMFRDGQFVSNTILTLTAERAQRWQQHECAMQYLRANRATAYTIVMTMWQAGTLMDNDVLSEWLRGGQSVEDRDDRIEVVMCMAGNREQTLSATLEIVRTQSGRINYLKRRPQLPGFASGLFHDLLLETPRGEAIH